MYSKVDLAISQELTFHTPGVLVQ